MISISILFSIIPNQEGRCKGMKVVNQNNLVMFYFISLLILKTEKNILFSIQFSKSILIKQIFLVLVLETANSFQK